MCMSCISLFVPLSFSSLLHCVVCPSITDSDYPFGIFKLFLGDIAIYHVPISFFCFRFEVKSACLKFDIYWFSPCTPIYSTNKSNTLSCATYFESYMKGNIGQSHVIAILMTNMSRKREN